MAEIPNRFHFLFGLKPQIETFHIVYFLCLESCRRVNQPDEIYFYYHYEPYGPWWERIRPHLRLERVDPVRFITDNEVYWRHQEGAFIKHTGLDYAHQSDFLRLQILGERGGVYADIDTLFVKPLPAALFGHEFVLGSEGALYDPVNGQPYNSVCNAVILSQPGARFGRHWLQEMYRLFDGTWSRHSCYGAAMLSARIPETIFIAPRRYFYRFQWTPEDIRLLLEGCDPDTEEVYSIHLWSHLWWDAARTDFSTMHKGMLTEEFIRGRDTTYTILARRFLD